jgi:hypothetical protein
MDHAKKVGNEGVTEYNDAIAAEQICGLEG